MAKMVALGHILTEKEIKQAMKIYKNCERSQFAERCAAEIIRPVIKRINKATKQENDPVYLAYCVEFSLLKARGHLDS